MLVCLDTIETRTYYALMQVNEGAPPTLINVYYVLGLQQYRFGGAYLANEQTYDDPIVIAYEFGLTTRWFYDILPSVNELINNDISNWTSDTSYPYASGELPKMEGSSPFIDGRSTDAYLGRLSSVATNSTARCQFFATPQAETFLNVYVDRSKMIFQSNNSGFINAWIRDAVAPVHDQAIISVPFGRITAADYRPQGAFRTRPFTLAPSFVNETLLPSLLDEGVRALTNPAVTTDRVSIIPSSNTVTFDDVTYLPIVVVSYDTEDGTSAQPEQDLVQYVRVYNYVIEDGVLTLDDTDEGILFNNEQYGTSIPFQNVDHWEILEISPLINSDGELLLMGTVGPAQNSQALTSVFVAGFGVFSVAGNGRRTQAFLM